jgi:hypothetical protein
MLSTSRGLDVDDQASVACLRWRDVQPEDARPFRRIGVGVDHVTVHSQGQLRCALGIRAKAIAGVRKTSGQSRWLTSDERLPLCK